jgi:transcription-repair coupling factor (superfamily II helicase)
VYDFFQKFDTDFESFQRLRLAGASPGFIQLVLSQFIERACQTLPPRNFQNLLIVVPSPKEIKGWHDYLVRLRDMEALPDFEMGVLPHFGIWGTDRLVNTIHHRKQRLHALSALLKNARPKVLITTLQGIAQYTLSHKDFAAARFEICQGDELELDAFLLRLSDLGYQRVAKVEEGGSWAVRGGIVDLFPFDHLDPLRIEFIGDQIGSIREFSAENQRSKEDFAKAVIIPANEALPLRSQRKEQTQALFDELLNHDCDIHDREGMIEAFREGLRFSGFDIFSPIFRSSQQSALDYLAQDDLVVFPGGWDKTRQSYLDFREAAQSSYLRDCQSRRATLAPDRHFCALPQLQAGLYETFKCVEFGNPFGTEEDGFIKVEQTQNLKPFGHGSLAPKDLSQWMNQITSLLQDDNGSVAILAEANEELEQIENLFSHRQLPTTKQPNILTLLSSPSLKTGRIYLGYGDLANQIWLDDIHTLVLPVHFLLGDRKRKRQEEKRSLKDFLSSFKDLKVGDLVVHVTHGIGKYLGMTQIQVMGVASDFLILLYSGGDKIYLPVDKLDLLQRYSYGSAEEAPASLDKLGGQAWQKRKSKVKRAIKDMAEELLRIQARRKLSKPMTFGLPCEAYRQFEEDFPYEETEGQLKALEDIEHDVMSGHAMDRLVVGDVGFGKTEIALRAAFRTVLEGYQVLVLVPTTVLCYQHFQTFSNRLSRYGVKVGQVNRFIKGRELTSVKTDLASGKVDILIGTHRLLSKDIESKRLGLIIVDEEQRFGVSHKERLKVMRANANVLTLTATPIPRTLHMSMIGLKDISIIATPPEDRYPVKTFISTFDESLIKESIELEIARGGQVFFVHNRVEDIEEIAAFVRKLIKHGEVRVAHGQMDERQLEAVVLDFIEQKFSILVCTTIIESGIDMPNVNTLIVNQADRLGLAQMYQLRGRVGRSTTQAFAYFFASKHGRLSDEAQKRLDILAANQKLGSGFFIASHDLEMRGAGNLLGGEQSGHIGAVGIEYYTDMLEAAIKEIRGEFVSEKIETEMKISVSAVISSQYIASENERLAYYKGLFSSESEDQIIQIRAEMLDRYGPMPDECHRLIKVASIKAKLRKINAAKLVPGRSGYLEIKFSSLKENQIAKLIDIVKERPERYKILPDYSLVLSVTAITKQSAPQQDIMLKQLATHIDPIVAAFGELL